MNVDYIVKIEVPTTTLKEGSTEQYEKVIGTGYPVRDGLVLTAQHVVFPEDLDTKKPIKLIWKREDAPEAFLERDVIKIEFYDKDLDIALLTCDISELDLPPMILSESDKFSGDGKRWKSHGYLTAGKAQGIRIKNPAGGTFFSSNPSHHVKWLMSDGNVDDDILWQGMSGAPVFDEMDRLAAVITKTPAGYNKSEGKLVPKYKDRLLATSIPYLLTLGKCDVFRKVFINHEQATKILPPTKMGDDFKDFLRDNIAEELRRLKGKTPVLHEELVKAFDSPLESSDSEVIALALLTIDDLENAVDLLAAASSECLLEDGYRYSTQLPLALIRSSAEAILGWLVLQAVKEEQLQTVLPLCTQRNSLFFNLKSVQSLSGIEIVMARRFSRKPDFNNQYGSEQESRYRITLPKEVFKWDGEKSTQRVFIEIWNQVFPHPMLQKKITYEYTPADVTKLNTRLKKLRNHARRPEHYYLSFTEYDYEDDVEFISGIYQDLLSELSEMTVIEYGCPDEKGHIFVIPEVEVRETINMFYDEINGELGNKI